MINYRVGVFKSEMETAVLKEINGICNCFSKDVILEDFVAYFEVLERVAGIL